MKSLHSPDVQDLKSFADAAPADFQLLVQAMIGPQGQDASESFDVVVCSVEALRKQVSRGPLIGLHHIVMARFDFDLLTATIRAYCTRCEGATWQEVAQKLGRLGHWEFDEYRDSG
ncbi:MAG: immunity 8 family protein [Myxococcaceae bacterium]